MSSSLIEVKNLSWSFKSRVVLTDLTFSIPSLSVTHLKGLNGTGKTTLLKILATLWIPGPNRVFIHQQDSHYFYKKIRPQLAFGSADPSGFFSHLTGFENLFTFYLLRGGIKGDFNFRVDELKEHINIDDFLTTPFQEMSKGMKSLTHLYNVFLHPTAHILLLDEPCDHLSSELKVKFSRLVEIYKSHKTIIFSSHDTFNNNSFHQIELNKGQRV